MVSNPRGEQSIVIAASFTAMTIIVVLLRIYTRLFMVRATGIEDYFTVAATVKWSAYLKLESPNYLAGVFHRPDDLHRVS
jgi:hypothetical protein